MDETEVALWNLVDVTFSEYPTTNDMISLESGKDVIRQWFIQQLGYEPGQGALMNFFDNFDPKQGNFISREQMFVNLKKLKN